MKIAVEGCAHGDLDNIYASIKSVEEKYGTKIDLLMCCGDFQSSRNEEDLRCMAVPSKYYNMCSFYKYYNGEKIAPVLTVFIGGNHEASNYLQELPYGGWVAPNIYYLGYAGVINVAGVRIGGISGIYKSHDYLKGHFEMPPYSDNTKRSVYHVRNLEVFRLKQLSGPIDIFLSHDWPAGVWQHGDVDQLLKFKPHFRDDIRSGEFGSPPCEELLKILKPTYWFSAHLHCKFAALVPHSQEEFTKFLSLDKCLPNRRFMQIIDIPHHENAKIELDYDLEWLTILHSTNHLLSVKNNIQYMPGPSSNERWNFTPTNDEKTFIYRKLNENLQISKDFVRTAKGHDSSNSKKSIVTQPLAVINPQTTRLCETLEITDPVSILISNIKTELNRSGLSNTTLDSFLDDSFASNRDLDSSDFQSPVKRTSLNLPKPKEDSVSVGDLNLDGESDGDEEKQTSVEELSDVPIDTDAPVMKRFKRRNANLYADSNSVT